MSYSTAREAAAYIALNFPLTESMDTQAATEWALRLLGHSPAAAFAEADERTAAQVGRLLRDDPRSKLRFTFSVHESDRLIGNGRRLRDDSDETREAKDRGEAVRPLLDAIYDLGPLAFEMICAGVMTLAGAEAHAICAGDEGGIDVYGRVPIRPERPGGLLATTLLDRRLLFLGQSKCYALKGELGPADVRELHGAVELCLHKYQGAQKLPSKRVPEDYYLLTEACLKVLFATCEISDKAREAAKSLDIHVIPGWQVAEVLVAQGIGIRLRDSTWVADRELLRAWAQQWDSRQVSVRPARAAE